MDLREQLSPPTRRQARQRVREASHLVANDIYAQTRRVVERSASLMARPSRKNPYDQSPSRGFSHGSAGASPLANLADRVLAARLSAPETEARAAREAAAEGRPLFGASGVRHGRPREALGATPVDDRNDETFNADARNLLSDARVTLMTLHRAIETRSRELWSAERSIDPTNEVALRQEIARLRSKAAAIIRAKADATLRPLELAHERAAAEARRLLGR
jgi:hypothetical protein